MEELNGFIDESGSYGFNFANHNTHFVVTVILVEQGEKTRLLQEEFDQIRRDIFHGAELKSSKIKDRTRQRIFLRLKKFDFRFYSLIVDKRNIFDSSGLRLWRESFYKYLYRQLYAHLYSTFSSITIFADELIDKNFIEGFETYIEKETQNTLFQQISFSNSATNSLIQLADLFAGTINRNLSGKSTFDLYYELIDKNAGFLIWPQKRIKYFTDHLGIDGFSKEIYDLSLLRADSYIEKHKRATDPDVILRVRFVEYLKEVLLYKGYDIQVYGAEILANINLGSEFKLNDTLLKTKVIAPLRDDDVLITSNRKGYKLPSSEKDIAEFFEMLFSNIDPMIKRMKNCYDSIVLATGKKPEFLEENKFDYIKRIITEST
jgi:hypothetical protein